MVQLYKPIFPRFRSQLMHTLSTNIFFVMPPQRVTYSNLYQDVFLHSQHSAFHPKAPPKEKMNSCRGWDTNFSVPPSPRISAIVKRSSSTHFSPLLSSTYTLSFGLSSTKLSSYHYPVLLYNHSSLYWTPSFLTSRLRVTCAICTHWLASSRSWPDGA